MSSGFLVELKRRRVVRAALVYGAVAFAVVQAADVFVPALALPGWILTAVALLAILGFPVALVLAWAYEIHPEGGPTGAQPDVVGADDNRLDRDAEGEAPPLRRRSEPAWLSVRTLIAVVVLVTLGVVIGSGGLIPSGAALATRSAVGEAPPPSPWVTRVPLFDGSELNGPPALSVDGRQFAWATADGIHIRSLDGLEVRTVPATDGAGAPFFSPDGRSLGFRIEDRLYTMALESGSARMLSDSLFSGVPVWGEDGWIYGQVRGSGAVARARADGGATELVLPGDSIMGFRPSWVLDGGRRMIGTLQERRRSAADAGDASDQIAVVDVATGDVTPLLTGRNPRSEPLTNHLVYLHRTALMAVAFDPKRLEVTGDSFVVDDDIGAFGLARDGTLWYVQGPVNRNIPVVVDARGQPRDIIPELSDREVFHDAYFSPDGERLVLELRAEAGNLPDIWTYELPAGPRTRLTYDGGGFPAWSPDGRYVLFIRDDGVYRVRSDASAPPERVLEAEGIGWIQPTPDGGIVFERDNGPDFDVGMAPLRGDDALRMLIEGPANEEDPAVSADGRWLAYESDETGRREVYVMPFGDDGRGRQISVAGGNNPLWSHDGRTLFFRNGQDEFEAIRIGPGSDLEVLGRTVLFDVAGLDGRLHPAPGDSLFMAKRGGPRSDARIILVRNWARELAARAEAVQDRR